MAIQLALRRGTVATDTRRDVLYGYQPHRTCLACRSVHSQLVVISWQYQDIWNAIHSNSDLKASVVIPPPRRVRLRDTFALPLVLRASRDIIKVSAKLESRDTRSSLKLTKMLFHKETFFLINPPTLTIRGLWRVIVYIQRETGASFFDFDILCE
ncbi:hypothetical protein BDV33DRAFT_210877 [Aspergillus novoparasiticus]|uniref:Uncharacterized protein n=1 Tax=Aspergillus novoparasiticus TaxID=986946 RepID=A0A5N6E6M8_9EURO|nr:hypothetical protein BDV33DRAFT_210877 [Aspergillus novoparasiticus]